ncbi:hypothetical protein H4R20_000344 [Coemansia guatemalensis]|uniref:Anaphase-promoting complex subunit 4 n=1 Tax=Coemansia guatemalensis TaxID=2761395 RepID=A0A9W8LVZ3_9FUNG|nr:hypothetical protein H4R20_000344 [Coemansia guatemalensis]
MTVNILSHSGNPYNTRGFRSLAEDQTLTLRTGAVPKQHSQTDYVLPRWCPCVDIIAVPEGRALRLVRLSGGQTVWRQTFNGGKARPTDGEIDREVGVDEYAIRAIAWSPSGTNIAILHANGQLIQRDSTRGDIVHESYIAIDDSAIAMDWVTCKKDNGEPSLSAPGDSEYSTSLEFSLPKLSPLDRGQPTPAHINPEAEDPTAIIITSLSGLVQVSLGGIFTLPAVGLPESIMRSSHDYAAIDARLSSDLAILYVYLIQSGSAKESADAPAPDNTKQNMVICAVDTSILSTTMPLLRMVVPLSARLSGLCLYLDNTLDLLVKEANARDESASRTSLLNTFEGVLRDHGVDEVTSPEAELARLAVTGSASESTSQFLLAKLKPAKLSNWESAGRLGAVALTRLIYQNALPAVERTILAATRLLDIVRDSRDTLAYTDNSSKESDRHSADNACNAILRVIVILGWIYARFNKYMLAIRDEQKENQEFVDWALCAIDDLHWQNEGSRRLDGDGHNDDADDGMRPVRPEIDYKLLFSFIRSAFRRPIEGEESARSICSILHNSDLAETSVSKAKATVESYFDALVDQAHLESLNITSDADGDAPFRYVFDQLGNGSNGDAAQNAATPPSCREALSEVRSLISEIFKWPSHALGSGLKWFADPVLSSPFHLGPDVQIPELLSDMHYVANKSGDGDSSSVQGQMYVATTSTSSQRLMIVTASASQHLHSSVAYIDLVVDVQNILDSAAERDAPILAQDRSKAPICVTDVSFFDDDLLGIVFTVEGDNQPFLGAIEYRHDADSIQYHNIRDIQHVSFDYMSFTTKLIGIYICFMHYHNSRS